MLSERQHRVFSRRWRRRPLLPFLIASTAAVDLAAAFTPEVQNSGDAGALLGLCLLGLVVGQIGLLAIWVASYRSGIATRLCVALPMLVVLALLLRRPLGLGVQVLGTYAGLSFATTLITCSLVYWVHGRTRKGIKKTRSPRFTIGWLIALTTATALVLVGARLLDWELLSESQVLVSVALESLVPAAVLAVVLFAGRVTTALYVLLTLVALGAFLAAASATATAGVGWALYLHCLGQVIVVAVWLLGLQARRSPPAPVALKLVGANAIEALSPQAEELPGERRVELTRLNVVV